MPNRSKALFLVGLSAVACTSSSESSDEVPTGTAVLHDTVALTAVEGGDGEGRRRIWLGRVAALAPDTAANALYLLDPDEKVVNYVSMSGRRMKAMGRGGEGPGELANPTAIALTKDAVLVLDLGNGKIVKFRRSSGEFMDESALRDVYYDLAPLTDSLIAFVPGSSGRAFDLLAIDGEYIASRGDGGWLPRSCAACQIVAIDSETVAVIDSEAPQMRTFSVGGEMEGLVSFSRMAEVLGRWKQDFQEIMQQWPHPPAGKVWFSDAQAVGKACVALAVIPEYPDRRPREIWLVDVEHGTRARMLYEELNVGNLLAVQRGAVSTYHIRDGGIYRYHFPEATPCLEHGWSQ